MYASISAGRERHRKKGYLMSRGVVNVFCYKYRKRRVKVREGVVRLEE